MPILYSLLVIKNISKAVKIFKTKDDFLINLYLDNQYANQKNLTSSD